MAAKELARLWVEATRKGERQAFEEEWFADDPPQTALFSDATPRPKRQRRLDEFASLSAVAGAGAAVAGIGAVPPTEADVVGAAVAVVALVTACCQRPIPYLSNRQNIFVRL